MIELSCFPENAGLKSRSASMPNFDFRIADGALKPELEFGSVKATVLPFRSSIFWIGPSAWTMISIS